jgi:hypothetical protein
MTTTEASTIRPGERRALKALVKMKVKALRAGIEHEHAKQLAEIDGRVAEKFRDDDRKMGEFKRLVSEVVDRANNEIIQLTAEYVDILGHNQNNRLLAMPHIYQRDDGKHELQRALIAAVHAQTAAARNRATQLEVELLETLEIGALKTDEAKEFVKGLPTVDSLMPSDRLTAIENKYGVKV